MAPARASQHGHLLEGEVHFGCPEGRRGIDYHHGPVHVWIENMGSKRESNLCKEKDEIHVQCRRNIISDKYEVRWNARTSAIGKWKSGTSRDLPTSIMPSHMQGSGQTAASEEEQLEISPQPEKGDKIWAAPDQEENLAEMEKAWDDVSGKELDSRGVREARAKEMTYIHDKQVWVKMSKQAAISKGCKVVGSRWVDVDKGDTSKPDYRSRLVAKEINTGPEEGLFASTPPLEAMRWLLSEAATVEPKMRDQEKVILISDVSRAFFEAPATRRIAVTLPDEALSEAEKGYGMVGVLQLSLYGTRDAAANFQKEVYKLMTGIGFKQSGYNASLYHKEKRGTRGGGTDGAAATGSEGNGRRQSYSTRGGGTDGLAATGAGRERVQGVSVLVHGDDFVATGDRKEIAEFRKALARRFTVKDKVIGSRADLGEVQETRVLNRIIRWTPKGWEYEADQRHAELIIRGMGMEDAKSVKTPGEDVPTWKLEAEEDYLDSSQATKFRMVVVRANYLASDRMDIQYATKECCRGMVNPQRRHYAMMKRLARCLVGRARMVWEYQ